VTACERCKQWEEAKELLVRMEVEGVRPDCKTYCSAISCCGAAGQWREAMNIFKDIDRTGICVCIT
jgi:pentatricopeptide repeat protein